MRLSFLGITCGFALLCGAALKLPAQDAPVPPDVKAFAAQYVAAFNSKDLVRFKALQLPQSLACITPENEDVYDWLLRAQMRDHVPPHYRVSMQPVNEQNLQAAAGEMSFPVKPEHEVHIDYEYPETRDGSTIVLWIARRNGRWMGDAPCMTQQAIDDFRAGAADREHYKAIATAIKDPLRSELMAMLRVHKTGEAQERYQQATGSDVRTATLVINALADQLASAGHAH